MYQDPSLIRKHVVKVRFSDREIELINALVNYTGEQKAAFIRDLVMNQTVSIMGCKSRPYEAA